VIAGPSTRKANQSIFLDGTKSVADRPLRWRLLGPVRPFLQFDQDGRKSVYAFVPDAEPGTYDFALVAIGKPDAGDGEIDVDVAIHRVVVGGSPPPSPDPRPDPDPGPGPNPPPPDPIAGMAWVTLVYDEAKGDAAIAAIRTDASVRAQAESSGVIWRSYDDDSKAVKSGNLLPYVAKAGGVPALIVQAKDGTVLASLPAPPTAAAVVEVLKKYRKAGGF